ncbi:hypothetical protein N7448_011363 [Penicillium atrosanguineum]|nr:hypothetical protein N7448_011363 [Penicillium atrosanguineum]KAJ5318678.1 hypothetical protein N7476_005098 [Penicillium atrosanguineum]
MIQSTVVLLWVLKKGNKRDHVPRLVEEAAAFHQLKELNCFRVVGGFFKPLDEWCIMVFYEGREVGNPITRTLRRHLAKYCLEGRTYEHVEPAAEPLLSEGDPDYPGWPWTWETRIGYFKGLVYRLKWDDLAHFENAKRYASIVDDELEASGITGMRDDDSDAVTPTA